MFKRRYEIILMIFQINFGQVPNFLVTMAVSIILSHIFACKSENVARVSASWRFNSDSSTPVPILSDVVMHIADFGRQ